MRIKHFSFLVILSLQLAIMACNRAPKGDEADVPPAGLAGANQKAGSINLDHPPTAGATHDPHRAVLKGKVVEAIYKEGFAYLRLELNDKESTWVAIVNQKPTVGQLIAVQEQAVLSDFHSKSLDRTFSKIVFGSIIE